MIRVFVNAAGVDVPAGSTALDAVRVWSAEAASDVAAGARLITDSRGLPIDADTGVAAGSIFRLIPKRDRSATDAADE
jgi:hypothetical protein